MSQPSLHNIRRLFLRQSTAIFGASMLVLILSCVLAMGSQLVLEQERAALTSDFTTTISYVREQEQFLRQLQDENTRVLSLLDPQPSLRRPATPMHMEYLPEAGPAFSLLRGNLPDQADARLRQAYTALASHLASNYSSFWTFSYYPSTNLLLLDASGRALITVPAVDAANAPEPLSPRQLEQIRQVAQQYLSNPQAERLRGSPPTSSGVRWFPFPGAPHKMLAFLPAGLPSAAWPGGSAGPGEHYMVSLWNHQRLLTASSAHHETPPYLFWLSNARQGILLGSGEPPPMDHDGFQLTAEGLVLCLHSQPGDWTGCFRIEYGSFVAENMWMPVTASLLLLLCLLWAIGYLRWYQRSIIDPAQQAQNALEESEKFNRELVATAPVALCLLSQSDGSIVFASKAALQWLELEPDATHPKWTSQAERHQVLEARKPGEIEQVELPSGRSLHVSYTPTRYRQQDVVLCAFTDITARAEEQRALERAKQAADEASEAKTVFLSTMSHEIRTPLYGVLGTLELLSLTSLDTVQRQHVARIQKASQLLMEQISDILDISKIEANQLQLEPSPFCPRRLVQECVGSYAGMAQQKQLLLFCLIDPQVPDMLEGDAIRIRQVLSNLVSNAIKFTAAGQIIVRLGLASQDESHCTVRFQVADTGIGIPPEALPQLFTPFYMAETNRHTIRGAGLGLSICERLVHLMDGHIHVTSEPGLGSQFSLTLPLQRCDATPPAVPALDGLRILLRTARPELTHNLACWLERWGAQASAAGTPLPPPDEHTWLLEVQMPAQECPPGWEQRYMSLAPADGNGTHPAIDACSVDDIAMGLARLGGHLAEDTPAQPSRQLALHVLIADDNPINQATLANQLEQLGCRVSMADDGAAALELWRRQAHDVVLTDVNMPRMNGYELSRALRAMGVQQPIIGITANATRNDGRNCMQSGMNTWLVKPIALDALYQQLARLCPAAVGTAAPAAPPTPTQPSPPASPPASACTPAMDDVAIAPVPEKYRALFRDTMTADLLQLEHNIQAQDLPQVLQNLHRISGGLAVVDNQALAEASVALQEQLRNQGLADAPAAELASLCRRLHDMIAPA